VFIVLELAKKLGEEVAGHEISQVLHHETIKTSLAAPLGQTSDDPASLTNLQTAPAKKRQRGG
jgi:hypothetical protein